MSLQPRVAAIIAMGAWSQAACGGSAPPEHARPVAEPPSITSAAPARSSEAPSAKPLTSWAATQCPELSEREELSVPVIWRRCPVSYPMISRAAICPNGRGCMKPCLITHRRDDDEWSERITYDEEQRVVGTAVVGDEESGLTTLEYEDGRLARQIVGESEMLRFAYDARGWLSHIVHGLLEKTSRVRYDDDGRVTAIDEVGKHDFVTEIRIAYDDADRLQAITTTSAKAGIEVQKRYHYDAAGRLRLLEFGPVLMLFDYGASGRLSSTINTFAKAPSLSSPLTEEEVEAARTAITGADVGFAREAFAYDAEGRLTKKKTWGVKGAPVKTELYRYDCP
jgi:YD repeat-containing protein